MSLLTLRDIGKIYVSEGNVAVGIRGVNLSFDRGEFVAVTGKSGSGKSTLLNVISGMDSYEEGELYIDGEPTSHYLQPEWEEYREKYISFIFQDYNIIDSFTVLENVELSLMHIEDRTERRKRALELLSRVGLTSHIHHKGSKLSGGQKQRTVIARALAKDSPIILADEPTGNLDSATSKEIIELLREVSRDKLLIVVTHNFDEVEAYATRHVRIFDGAVESDHVIREPEPLPKKCDHVSENKGSSGIFSTIKGGFTLGKTIFKAKPKLSLFLCLLMIIGTLGIFGVTTVSGDAALLFEKNYMFNHIDGRVVLTTQSGEVLSEDEVKKIAEEYGARDYLRFDHLLDEEYGCEMELPVATNDGNSIYMHCTFGENFGKKIIGRYPKSNNEVLLSLPISYQPIFGKKEIQISEIMMHGMTLSVVGIHYYYDNNIEPKCLFTEEGFNVATAIYYMVVNTSPNISVTVTSPDGNVIEELKIAQIAPSFDIASDKVYLDSGRFDTLKKELGDTEYEVDIMVRAVYYLYNYFYGESMKSYVFTKWFGESDIAADNPVTSPTAHPDRSTLYISDELLYSMASSVLDSSYKQVSLFFENDREATAAAERLQAAGYIAVPSNTTYEPSVLDTIMKLITGLMSAVLWVLAIVFLAFFVNLCSGRALDAFKGDMAIMRSMGIGVRTICVAMYVRMLLSLIPAFLLVVAVAVLIFTTPAFNSYFVYLYAWQYALIFLGMLILTLRITNKQISRLFSESVKKSLKGGVDK